MWTTNRLTVLGAAIVGIVSPTACGGDNSKSQMLDASISDATSPDTSVFDAGASPDASVFDAGASPDASVFDAGASPDASVPVPEPGTINQVLDVSTRDLDILFVVDNSGTMGEEQNSLVERFDVLTTALATIEGGLPNLHIGVISTDLGAGVGITGCTVPGDDGLLQNQPRLSGCAALSDRYLLDLTNPQGGREQNFTGSLEEAFACIAALGTAGCGFEQHFAAIERALDGSVIANAGFLRDDAMLAIVVLSDEDDCSADPYLYDVSGEQNSLTSTLGPLTGYRCFEFGVTCAETTNDPPADRVNYGIRTECVPRAGSPYMNDVSHIVSFLNGLKSSPGLVMLNVIGGVGDVAVEELNGKPRLAPACETVAGKADPGIRLEAASALLGMGATKSICAMDLGPALTGIAEEMVARMSGTCLVEDTPNSCIFNDVSGYGTEAEQVVQTLFLCSESVVGACVNLISNSQDCDNGKTEVVIDRRGTAPPPNTVAVASCSS